MRHRWVLWAIALNIWCAPGCVTVITQMKDLRDEVAVNYHNRHLADQAWNAVSSQYAGQPCLEDFACGFKQGYCDLAAGGRGCPPALPPRKYWRAKYLGGEGHSRVAEWFSGYRYGVGVGYEDGVDGIGRIPTSVPSEAPKAYAYVGNPPPVPDNGVPPATPQPAVSGATAPIPETGELPPINPNELIPIVPEEPVLPRSDIPPAVDSSTEPAPPPPAPPVTEPGG